MSSAAEQKLATEIDALRRSKYPARFGSVLSDALHNKCAVSPSIRRRIATRVAALAIIDFDSTYKPEPPAEKPKTYTDKCNLVLTATKEKNWTGLPGFNLYYLHNRLYELSRALTGSSTAADFAEVTTMLTEIRAVLDAEIKAQEIAAKEEALEIEAVDEFFKVPATKGVKDIFDEGDGD